LLVVPQDGRRLVQGQVTLTHPPSLSADLRLGDILSIMYISDIIYIRREIPMADRGRPQSTKAYFKILLRLPPALQARVEHCHALLQRQHGPKFTQTEALWHLLAAGCAAVEGALEGREISAPEPIQISEISDVSPRHVSDILDIYNGIRASIGDEEKAMPAP